LRKKEKKTWYVTLPLPGLVWKDGDRIGGVISPPFPPLLPQLLLKVRE